MQNNDFVDPDNPIFIYYDLIDYILKNNRQLGCKRRQRYNRIIWHRLLHSEFFKSKSTRWAKVMPWSYNLNCLYTISVMPVFEIKTHWSTYFPIQIVFCCKDVQMQHIWENCPPLCYIFRPWNVWAWLNLFYILFLYTNY